MNRFDPAFDVTRVDSMQWNRSGAVDALRPPDEEASRGAAEISPEVLQQVREAIEREVSGSRDELGAVNGESHLDPAGDHTHTPERPQTDPE